MDEHKNAEVQITLTADEAIVLFEFVSRYSDTDELKIVDQAEERALWNLCCIFEKKLAVPFNVEYAQVLSEARARLRDDK